MRVFSHKYSMKYFLNPIEYRSIKDMPARERPREKLQYGGVSPLSDIELMCILLGRGTRLRPVQDIAHDVLDCIARQKCADLKALSEIEGVGPAQATTIVSALELGRRLGSSVKRRVSEPKDIFDLLRHYGDREQEHFIVIMLNGAMEVIRVRVVTVGLVNKTLVHPREVFTDCIRNMGTAVILAHNHPSGNLEPSNDDIELTMRLRKAGDILGIEVLDHFIFTSEKYYSMREEGEFWS